MEQLISALLEALRAAGLHTVPFMSSTLAPRLEAPACAVQLSKAELSQPGFAQYLGTLEDPEQGTKELYGARLEATATVWVYSPTALGAGGCTAAVGQVTDVLLSANGSLQLAGLTIEPAEYDPKYDHFCAKVHASLRTWVYSSAPDEAQRFTNFNLRGVLE